jgi:hypothetical protein
MKILPRRFLMTALLLLGLLRLSTAAYAVTPPIYDSFDNPHWDDSFNDGLWYRSGDIGVLAKQADGYLSFTGTTTADNSYTNLVSRYPDQRTLSQLQRLEGRFLVDNPQGGWSSVSLQVQSEDINGHVWWTTTGITVHPSGAEGSIFCATSTYTPQQGVQTEWLVSPGNVPLGEWHTLALEIDLTTARFRCEVDGGLLDAHTPADAAALLVASNLSARIVVGQETPQSAATRLVDDVRLPAVVEYSHFVHLPLIVQ